MKFLSQIGIILGICWVSTVIEAVLPFSFPATVIALILTLLLLLFKVLKIEQIQEFSGFLFATLHQNTRQSLLLLFRGSLKEFSKQRR